MGNTVGLVKKYLKSAAPVYLETGSSAGQGLENALDAGAGKCIGIECDKERMGRAKDLFEGNEEVVLIEAQSERVLKKALNEHGRDNMIIFLDAHKVSGNPMETYPLLFELNEIKNSKVKNATIMIDDVRLFNSELNAPIAAVFEYIMSMIKDYKIVFEDSDTNQSDVLVAYV